MLHSIDFFSRMVVLLLIFVECLTNKKKIMPIISDIFNKLDNFQIEFDNVLDKTSAHLIANIVLEKQLYNFINLVLDIKDEDFDVTIIRNRLGNYTVIVELIHMEDFNKDYSLFFRSDGVYNSDSGRNLLLELFSYIINNKFKF